MPAAARARPAGEGVGVMPVALHQPAEDAVPRQHVVDLAGHVGGEAGDPSAPRSRPTCCGCRAGRSGARSSATAVARASPRIWVSSPRITSGNAVRVGRVIRPGTSRTGRSPSALTVHEAAPPAPAGPAGQGGVGRLAPALAAADHAGRQHRAGRRSAASQSPTASARAPAKCAVRHLEDARALSRRCSSTRAVGGDAVGAQAGGAPVEADQRPPGRSRGASSADSCSAPACWPQRRRGGKGFDKPARRL